MSGHVAALIVFLLLAASSSNSGVPTALTERQVADKVAELVQQSRKQANRRQLDRIEEPQLRDAACKRAASGAKSWRNGCDLPSHNAAIDCFSYSTSDPAQAIPELVSWANQDARDPRRFAIGVCAQPSGSHGETQYWIEMRTYMGPAKSFFWRTGYGLAHLWSR